MKNKTVISVVVSFTIFIVTLAGYRLHFFEKPEYFLHDVQARMIRTSRVADPKIKVILVDEASLKAMDNIAGRWPWPRAIWGDLLDYLSIGGARAVLFDILFIEQDKNNKANDKTLIQATKVSKNVYHSMLLRHEEMDDGKSSRAVPLPDDFVRRFAIRHVTGSLPVKPGSESNDYAIPIPHLAEAAKGMAVVEFKPDSDSVLRRTKPLREYQGKYFPVLGLAPFINEDSHVTISNRTLKINDRTIPLDENGDSIINMYGLDNVEMYSISGIFKSLQQIRQGDVEHLLVSPEIFRDSIVYVGASAIGAADLKAIPMGDNAPGVLLHAFQASNYLKNDFMSPPARSLTIFSMLLGIMLTAWAVMYAVRLAFRILIPVALLILYITFAFVSFRFNAQVELVPFIFATIATAFASFSYITFTEGAEKRMVSQLFSQYVSKEVLNEVLNNYQEYMKSSAGQKVEITVLFSDIRGFTTMSETTEPEKIVEMLNVHFKIMADIILKHNGTIDKYIGDAIMAFWGAPVKSGNHAEEAVLAGQEMLEGLKEVNRILKERGFNHEIHIGIGINTGMATIGNIGSDKKMNYTVVGDAVNLSSRLESITKEYKTPLLFSEYTYGKIKDKIDCRLIGNVTVKGREQSVDIYTTNQKVS